MDLLQVGDTVEEVIQYMQKKLTDWNDAIGVTGGILSPSKCWWYLVTFRYISGQWKAVSPDTTFNLWLRNEKKNKIAISQIDPSIGTNMLGVHLAPDGNTKDHIAALRAKADAWAKNITSSRANSEEVWTALHRTIPFSMSYSFTVVTLTEEECQQIMAPIIMKGLPRAGVVSTIPKAFRMGPIAMGGLGLLDPYIHMGVSKIENFISNTWQRTPTGILQEIVLDDFALELGISSPWTVDRLRKGVLYAVTDSWIRYMVRFALEQKVNVSWVPYSMISPKRLNDSTIMDMAMASIDKASQLQAINKIRMSLHIIWISDIATSDGLRIDDKWFRPLTHTPQRAQARWPKVHHITRQDWVVWRKWLQSITRPQGSILIQPLGAWQCSQQEWIEEWDSFAMMNDELLYIKASPLQGWRRHVLIPGRHRRMMRYYREYLHIHSLDPLPRHLKRVSYKTYRTYIEVTATEEPPLHWMELATYHTTWSRFAATKMMILQKIKDVLNPVYLDSTTELDLLLQDFTRGTIISVSDGSYFRETNQAAAAWIIESACGTQWITGSILVPGPVADYSSYRSELMGLLAISLTLKIYSCCCQMPQHVIIACDGEAALKAFALKREDVTANMAHADILSALVDVWESVDMLAHPVHVQGHQDDTHHGLSRLERLNVLMDRLAQLTAKTQTTNVPSLNIPFMGIRSVEYNGETIGGQVYKTLYNGITSLHLKSYYDQKLFRAPCTLANTALASFQHARSHAHNSLLKFMSKWLSNTVATGIVLQRRNHRVFNRCPCCNAWGEDRLHIITCWDQRAKIIRNQYLNGFIQSLHSTGTHPEIITFLKEGLTEFFNRPNTRRVMRYAEHWQQEQTDIGWMNFLSGFISKDMVDKQHHYYRELGCRRTGRRWASSIITHNWTLVYKLWLERNEVLHQKDTINSISGALLLDIEVEREYDAGYHDLPQSIHKWFRMSKSHLMEQSVEYKKGWLLLVRTVRESLQIAEYSIFSSSKALRKWVGLNR
jgi:hypothetical protein